MRQDKYLTTKISEKIFYATILELEKVQLKRMLY